MIDESIRLAIKKIKSVLERDFSVIFAYIHNFQECQLNKICISVYLQNSNMINNFLRVLMDLSNKISYKLDIIILNTASPTLRYRIISNGKILFTKDTRVLKEFINRTLSDISKTEKGNIKNYK
ncbi:MAG: nucleotidyltransferase domain-containing protein [Candidatus Asgardarchaeia archaeon]